MAILQNSTSKKQVDATYVAVLGELKSQIDKIWNIFWSNGIANPLSIVEHISYLLFLRQLSTPKIPHKWSWDFIIKEKDATNQSDLIVSVFEYLKSDVHLQMEEKLFSTYQKHMREAVFIKTNPLALQQVILIVEQLPLGRDTLGDLYEYMLHKISVSGRNGQFRTPRHIIEMMVQMIEPKSTDIICDPACGTGGFLLLCAEYVRKREEESKSQTQFVGYDFDRTMLRLTTMNMILHSVEHATIEYRNALSHQDMNLKDSISVLLANPPFKGAVIQDELHPDLVKGVKTAKSELLFLRLFLCLLTKNGRAGVIVPDGVLFGRSAAHVEIRKQIIEEHILQGVVSLPSGVFQPYSGVSTSILFFQRTDCGGTDQVWFYDMCNDGFSLNTSRNPIEDNDIPEIIDRWKRRFTEQKNDRISKCFFVQKSEIVAKDYDLSIHRYRHVDYEEEEYQSPIKNLTELKAICSQIHEKMIKLEDMLK
jgi:type I restriction enzyme M protein